MDYYDYCVLLYKCVKSPLCSPAFDGTSTRVLELKKLTPRVVNMFKDTGWVAKGLFIAAPADAPALPASYCLR
eukprot:scaffold34776_cov20-Tisochrysis_lutea.AAC.1